MRFTQTWTQFEVPRLDPNLATSSTQDDLCDAFENWVALPHLFDVRRSVPALCVAAYVALDTDCSRTVCLGSPCPLQAENSRLVEQVFAKMKRVAWACGAKYVVAADALLHAYVGAKRGCCGAALAQVAAPDP